MKITKILLVVIIVIVSIGFLSVFLPTPEPAPTAKSPAGNSAKVMPEADAAKKAPSYRELVRANEPAAAAQRKALAQAAKAAKTLNPFEAEKLAVQACAAAGEAVLAKLKAPATARLPGCQWNADEYEIRANAKGTVWFVTGHVDAQNSFGAMLRRRWIVELRLDQGKQWTVRRVEFE